MTDWTKPEAYHGDLRYDEPYTFMNVLVAKLERRKPDIRDKALSFQELVSRISNGGN